jgi:hypothetical protein
MNRFFLLLFSQISALSIYAQSYSYDEDFSLSFSVKDTRGQWLFKGSDHSFSITVLSKKIQETESPGYVTVDNAIVQVTALPLPKSNLDLAKLTIAQQKETLEGYVSYELDYFKNDLKINYKNLRKEWITTDSKLWLLWYFDATSYPTSEPVQQRPKIQIYASTICYNQLLDLNTPVMKVQDLTSSKELINKLMSSLKL